MLVAMGRGSVTYPVFVVSVGRVRCRGLLDWLWQLLRICSIARLTGEAASAKVVEADRNDDVGD